MAKHLAPFDRARDFTVQRDMTYLGIDYAKGADFPKELATTRSLRILYESRAVGYRGAQTLTPLVELRRDFRTRRRPGAQDMLDHDGDGRKGGAKPLPPTDDNAPLDTPEARAAFELAHTKPQLKVLVAALGVTIAPRWTKADLVDELARHRNGASGR